MQSRDFVYWLQGFFEVSEAKELSQKQVDIIKNHLNLVFVHDIDAKDDPDKAELYQSVHDGKDPTIPYFADPKNKDTLMRC